MLNNNQLIAVQLVAQGRTGKFISEHLNVAQETISRWRKKPEFIASVNVMLNQLRDSTQQKMRNILFLSLEILEKELIKENSTIKVNLALKITQNYKITNLIDEKIGSENSKNIEKKLFEKQFDEMF
tara:strand:+ start:166 stop:546 length:381 start_codon:yes stop_codon:yes gene_type:complete